MLALFGSVLSTNFRPESDADVRVSFESDARMGFIAFSRMQREFFELFKHSVALVPLDGLKPAIRDSVLANFEEVYST